MGPGFRAPAVERFMEIARAWALHPWPMTRAQGIATYKALGWVRADDDIESFTTDSTGGEAESFFYADLLKTFVAANRIHRTIDRNCRSRTEGEGERRSRSRAWGHRGSRSMNPPNGRNTDKSLISHRNAEFAIVH